VGLLDATFDPLIDESAQLTKILGKIVHTAISNRDARRGQRSRVTHNSP